MALSLKARKCIRLYSPFSNLLRYSSSSLNRKGLVLGVYTKTNDEGVELTPAAEKYNNTTQGKLLEQIKLAGNKVKVGNALVFWGLENEFQSVAVVGLGKKDNHEDIELICHEKEAVRVAASAGCRALDSVGVKDIHVESFCDAESAAEGSILGTWTFQEYKTKDKNVLPKVYLYKVEADESNCNDWQRGSIKAEAQNLARRLMDTPSNRMTPTIFAEQAQKILTPLGVQVNVYDKKWAEDQKMFLFLSVSAGSVEPPKFLEITYNKQASSDAPFVLVGKGVTFDTGGVSLKPSTNMEDMRADMGGAASLLSTVYGVAKLNLPANLKLLIPLTENMVSGTATKPGDIFTARNGKTVCVENTDAEGRLILADALSYSAEFKPKWVLDMATLTGAMRIALGSGATGVYSNSDNLYSTLQTAGTYTGDRVWRLPLWKHYIKPLQHPACDLYNNAKKGGGGANIAASFLREFVPDKTDWMHLDIAGVMGPNDPCPYLKGMTGRPTRTVIEFIERQLKQDHGS